MTGKLNLLSFSICLLVSFSFFGQNISLFKQYNGRFDYTFIGNTLNTSENNITGDCTILTSSSASLNLNTTDVVENAYLYWAGSGTGDFDVTLNGISISSQRNFALTKNSLDYFGCFATITTLVQTTGNGIYTLSDLDLTSVITNQTGYCGNRTNFGGWAIIIVYKNNALPLNQLNIYDGLQGIPDSLDITLDSLNVVDNNGAKIAFITWEGDSILAVNETLTFNGNALSNSLNPANNQFNGTNTFTGSNILYNMDLDEYDIQNNIQIGDTTAAIKMTSGQDFVMINAIVTKLNSQLPDATIVLDNLIQNCDSRELTINYTVRNFNSTHDLQSHVPVSFYADSILIGTTFTNTILPIDGSESNQITIQLPASVPDTFILKLVVDDTGQSIGSVIEINETNNNFIQNVTLWFAPMFNILPDLKGCDIGFSKAIFNFSNYFLLVKVNNSDTVSFFESILDAENNTNSILNTSNYESNTPKQIFVRINNEHCYNITSFMLNTMKCPPNVYNAVSANNDGQNDTFYIEGLRNIFLKFELSIYNRWGKLIWTGNNSTLDWDGYPNSGSVFNYQIVPDGTYFYVLELNDPDFPKPINGYLYFTKE